YKEKQEKIAKEKKKPTEDERKRLMEKYANLAQPKDKWKTGRVMLGLKKQFTYDNILKKMIKLEFKENRKFKYPEEYAVYDSDEERKILFRNGLDKLDLAKEKEMEKENVDKIKSQIHKTKLADDTKRKNNEKK